MKVCFVAPEFLPVVGGVGTHIVELIKHLPKDIEIHVITLKRKIPNSDVDLDENEMKKHFNRDINLNVITEAKDEFLYNAKFQLGCYKWIKKLYKEEKIDLFHSHFGHMPDLLIKLRGLDIPIITTAHLTNAGLAEGIKQSGIRFKDLETAGKYSLALAPFLEYIEGVYLRKSKNIIAVSDWMRDLLIKNYKIRSEIIKTIPNGVDSNKYHPNIHSKILSDINDPIVLFTGRLTSTKGINYLIKSIPKILKVEKDIHFVFVGGGNPKPYLEEMNRMKIPDDKFSFLGYIKDENDMAAIYSKASIYVAPTLYENLPIRILEAMSSGTPVVASNVCAIPEVIMDGVNGFLIPPKNVDSLCQKILFLIRNKDVAEEMGISARNTILSNFEWTEIAEKTANLYNSIIENKKYS